jgi:hypothetical protein
LENGKGSLIAYVYHLHGISSLSISYVSFCLVGNFKWVEIT